DRPASPHLVGLLADHPGLLRDHPRTVRPKRRPQLLPQPARPGTGRPPMITREQAALRAKLILELPADNPEHGWELREFPQGWLIRQQGWEGRRGQFSMVIERENGLV